MTDHGRPIGSNFKRRTDRVERAPTWIVENVAVPLYIDMIDRDLGANRRQLAQWFVSRRRAWLGAHAGLPTDFRFDRT
jgi:hypothetical protein